MNDRRSELRAWLAGHVGVDEAERDHTRRCERLLETSGDPFSRDHFEPGHFTASAFVLSPRADALLLIFHAKLERWLQPGGHVDPEDASLLDAARREAQEEVGIAELVLENMAGGAEHAAPVFDVDVHTFPARGREPEHDHFDIRFLFRARSRDFALSREALAARWMPLSELVGPDADHSVARAAAKLAGSSDRRAADPTGATGFP